MTNMSLSRFPVVALGLFVLTACPSDSPTEPTGNMGTLSFNVTGQATVNISGELAAAG
jgi:hypothetical protein